MGGFGLTCRKELVVEFYTLWCEWDYGQQNMLFVKKEHGRIWLEQEMKMENEEWFAEEFPNGVQDVFDEGLAGFEVARVFAVH